MSWQRVNETLSERIHLAEGPLSGAQNSQGEALTEASCSPSPLLVTWPPFPAGLPPGTPRLGATTLPGPAGRLHPSSRKE